MNRRLLLFAGLALLAGCATAPPAVLTTAQPTHPELEAVYSALAGREALTLEVISGGCTEKADFTFYVERNGEAVTLSFARKRLDPCRSLVAAKKEISFTWAELGLEPHQPVFLLNPLTPWVR
jgi:hypothetical protein